MLKTEFLPKNTSRVFDLMRSLPEVQGFTLIGGTALALQIGHRISEDIDFWLPSNRLDKSAVSEIVRFFECKGIEARLITPHEQIVSSKINGIDLLSLSQDYSIGGAKVTFFARKDMAFSFFDQQARLPNPGASFNIMGVEGIFLMKAYVIHQRVRSRDLFDLMTLMDRGHSIESILNAGRQADPACSVEYAKSILTGDVPLDKNDEGLSSINVQISIDDIYAKFSSAINEYEQQVAMRVARSSLKAALQKSFGGIAIETPTTKPKIATPAIDSSTLKP